MHINSAPQLTQQRLKELLHYDANTGALTWLQDRGRLAKAGQPAGTVKRNGYVEVCIDSKHYKAHRLAWLYVHGCWPLREIDHIDRNPRNNAMGNLRDVCGSLNALNKPARDNKTGHTGIYWNASCSRYYAQISLGGKNKHLGMFDNLDDAMTARSSAAIAYQMELVGRAGLEPATNRL